MPGSRPPLAVYAGAAVVAGPLTGVVVRRLGSARAATAAVAALAAATTLTGVARTWWMLTAAFTLAGLVDPLIDVAVNRQSLSVQRGYGRSILAAVHATWCLGAVAGGLLGSAAAGTRLSLPIHLGAAATVGVAVVALTARQLLPDGPSARPEQPAVGPRVRPRAAVLRAVAGSARSRPPSSPPLCTPWITPRSGSRDRAGLLSPALVGAAAADVVSLRAALVLVPTAALIALLLTGYLATRQQPPAMR